MKKLGFLVGELGKGGQETQLTYLLLEFQKRGYQCFLIVWTFEDRKKIYSDDLEAQGVKLLLLQNMPFFQKIVRSRAFIHNNHLISVQSFAYYLNVFAWLISLGYSSQPIGAIRTRLKLIRLTSGFAKFWLNAFFPIPKVSNNNLYREGFNFPAVKVFFRKTRIITNHLDIGNFKFEQPQHSEIFRTASVSRLYPEKSLDVLIKVIAVLVKLGVPIHHQHAGSGALLDELKDMVTKEGLKDHFEFVGEQKNISDFLQSKDLLIHTSTFEGYPNVVMEALACGKAVVSTDCGDVRFLVESGSNGFVCKVGDVEGLAKAVHRLHKNRSELRLMALAARKQAEENFQVAHLADETLNLYRDLGILDR